MERRPGRRSLRDAERLGVDGLRLFLGLEKTMPIREADIWADLRKALNFIGAVY